ncbi:MAG: AAA family ATPase [Actinomycetota bacterium]
MKGPETEESAALGEEAAVERAEAKASSLGSRWNRWRTGERANGDEGSGYSPDKTLRPDLTGRSPSATSSRGAATQAWEGAAVAEMNPWSPILQQPLIVALFVLLFAGLGALYSARLTPTFVAEAGLVVEDTRRSSLFVTARPTDPERYIADQIAVLRSRAVAEEAARLAPTLDPGGQISVDDLLADSSISSDLATDFLTISFVANDPITAQVGANAIGLAYEQVVQARLAEDSANALAELDEATDDAVQRVLDIQRELEATQASAVDRQLLEEQMSAIVEELADLRSSAATTDEIRAKADQLAAELQARLLLTEVEDSAPGVTLLLRRLEDGLTLLSELTLRRSQLEVDAQLAGNGVALFSAAGEGKRTGSSTTSNVAMSVVLGGLVGSAGAYWLSERRRRLVSSTQAERVLGVPLLGDIPNMHSTVLDVGLVVEAVPRSPGAEAFQALVEEIRRELKEREGADDTADPEGARTGAVIAVTSPGFLEGKTVVAMNTALAAARAGLRALLIDADPVSEQASSLLAPFSPPGTNGMTEVVVAGTPLNHVLAPVSLGGRFVIDLLRRGQGHLSNADLYGSPAAARAINELAGRYDLVVMDNAPLLQWPDARAAVQKADYALVVVKHRDLVEGLEELLIRLNLIGVPVLGYVYDRAPRLKQATDAD